MKIVLSQRMRREAIGVFGVEFGIMLLAIPLIYEDFALWVAAELFIFVFMTSVFGILMCCRFRLFTHVINEADCFRAFLHKKELCVIDKRKPIYYVKFTALLTKGVEAEMIVISNQPFEYKAPSLMRIFPRESKALIHSYNVRTQIAMPYNAKTIEIMEMGKWHSVV